MVNDRKIENIPFCPYAVGQTVDASVAVCELTSPFITFAMKKGEMYK